LLVDDDLALGTALQQLLTREGHRVVWLRTIEDARRFMSDEAFSIVLLDMVFPGGSGLDLVRWMRNRGIDTPVLMLTGARLPGRSGRVPGRRRRRLSPQADRGQGAALEDAGADASSHAPA
jgi:CheY-like chemotaxis protein